MPLSTSSSENNFLPARMGKTWVVAIVIVCLALGVWELFWRFQGFLPSVEDDMNIWQLQRSKVSAEIPLIIMGSSRAQLGLHPDVIMARLDVEPVNLSVDGNPPFSVLKDVAENTEFKGIVICSVLPRWLAEKSLQKDRAAKWVKKYKKRTLLSRVDTRISMGIQMAFVFRYPGLSPEKLIKQIRKGKWPAPPYAPMRADRYREAEFNEENTSKILESRVRREKEIAKASVIVSKKEYEKRIKSIQLDVKKIKARGGNVLFVRMPSSGKVRQVESITWPRALFWDRFADQIDAPAIHFEDFSEVSGFLCPDGSHLDGKDAKVFTGKLLDLIFYRKLLEPR